MGPCRFAYTTCRCANKTVEHTRRRNRNSGNNRCSVPCTDNTPCPLNRPLIAQCGLCRSWDGSWRMTVDYRELNKVVPPLMAVVPNMVTLLEEVGKSLQEWKAVVDLANAFSPVAISPASQGPLCLHLEC